MKKRFAGNLRHAKESYKGGEFLSGTDICGRVRMTV